VEEEAMKKVLLFMVLSLVPVLAFGQVIFNFDSAPADTNFWNWKSNHGGQHYEVNTSAAPEKGYVRLSYVTDQVQEGAGAMRYEYSAHNTESWGGYAKIEHFNLDTNAVYDYSKYDSIGFWYNNLSKQTLPGRAHVRFELYEVSDAANGNATYSAGQCEFYYSFEYILDDEPGWKQFKLPLLDGRNEDLMDEWNGGAFNRTGWAGISGNDILNPDKIKGWGFEISISGAGEGDNSSGVILLDDLRLIHLGKKAIVFFNGREAANFMAGPWTWGQSACGYEEGAGVVAKTNAIKWTQGNEWGNGWSGMGWNLSPAVDMSTVWDSDSLSFYYKTDEGVGPIRFQLEDGAAKVGSVFTPIADNQWHRYAFKLSEMAPQDGTSGFKTNAVTVLGVMAEASAVAGKVVYLSNIWTGTPVIDVVAPNAPTGIAAIAQDGYNLVIWEDVPGEEGEVYNVYASTKPFTSITDPGVMLIASKVAEGTQTFAHYIYSALTDKNKDYYYAVMCKDASSNESPAGIAGPFTNVAKGIPTIALNPPANFVADGDMTEWVNSGIMPFVLKPSTSNIAYGQFSSDDDLTVTVWLAVDDNNLYMAADAIDDVYSYAEGGNWYEDDGIELYIGLYNQGAVHTVFKRGAEPDYSFYFITTGLMWGNGSGGDFALYPNATPSNYTFVDFGAADYACEVKIPLDSLVTHGSVGDTRFHPVNGMRIPIEIMFHDSDAANVRAGVLSFSTNNADNAWQSPANWAFTWVGDQEEVTGVESKDVTSVETYSLSQNYPNPFNPTTTISYTLPKAGKVSIDIFNMIGQKVATLVNANQTAGIHTVAFDGANLTSGVYFYRLQAGNYTTMRKMVLMK
jgi:hypothetical protein